MFFFVFFCRSSVPLHSPYGTILPVVYFYFCMIYTLEILETLKCMFVFDCLMHVEVYS